MVQSFLTYIHYLDQPSQRFNQSTKKTKWKQNNFHLQLQDELTQAHPLQTQRVIKLLFKEKIELKGM